MSVVPQWYVECDNVANEQVSALLMAQADGREGESVGKKDKDGNPHCLLRIPKHLIGVIERAKREQPKIYRNVRFWVEDTTQGTVRPADFLRSKRPNPGVDALVAQARENKRIKRHGRDA